jgi:hypothetical protein
MRADYQKAEQMVLYMCHKSKRDPLFGKVKLAKLMFYADFFAYRYLGQPITGLDYKKLPQGPVPTQAKRIQEHLVETGQAVERTGNFNRQQLVPVDRFSRKKFEGIFTQAELNIMDQVYDKVRPMKAYEVSDLSHEFVGWQLAENEEVIPYGTILISDRSPTQEEIDYGLQLADELGLR